MFVLTTNKKTNKEMEGMCVPLKKKNVKYTLIKISAPHEEKVIRHVLKGEKLTYEQYKTRYLVETAVDNYIVDCDRNSPENIAYCCDIDKDKDFATLLSDFSISAELKKFRVTYEYLEDNDVENLISCVKDLVGTGKDFILQDINPVKTAEDRPPLKKKKTYVSKDENDRSKGEILINVPVESIETQNTRFEKDFSEALLKSNKTDKCTGSAHMIYHIRKENGEESNVYAKNMCGCGENAARTKS
jgi:hypothetical protein